MPGITGVIESYVLVWRFCIEINVPERSNGMYAVRSGPVPRFYE